MFFGKQNLTDVVQAGVGELLRIKRERESNAQTFKLSFSYESLQQIERLKAALGVPDVMDVVQLGIKELIRKQQEQTDNAYKVNFTGAPLQQLENLRTALGKQTIQDVVEAGIAELLHKQSEEQNKQDDNTYKITFSGQSLQQLEALKQYYGKTDLQEVVGLALAELMKTKMGDEQESDKETFKVAFSGPSLEQLKSLQKFFNKQSLTEVVQSGVAEILAKKKEKESGDKTFKVAFSGKSLDQLEELRKFYSKKNHMEVIQAGIAKLLGAKQAKEKQEQQKKN